MRVRRNIAVPFGVENPKWAGYQTVKSFTICLAVSTEYRRVTDRRTSFDSIVRAMHGEKPAVYSIPSNIGRSAIQAGSTMQAG